MSIDLHLRRSIRFSEELGESNLVDSYLISARKLATAHRECEDVLRRIRREAKDSGMDNTTWKELVYVSLDD